MCQKIIVLCLILGLFVVNILALAIEDTEETRDVEPTDYEPTDDEIETDADETESIQPVETKMELLEYEEPGEGEGPVDYVVSLFYQIFGVTVRKIAVKLVRGITAVVALLIVTLSAMSYTM